ncbi:MAG: Rrf2 family transcriptional regulator [Chloroflexota bacterium]|nr:Rrf2 family transcriptional regulator [Chloroflexota bacterium]
MRVSSRGDYGVRALFDLALRFEQGPTQSRDIAARRNIPEAYLHQVLGALNRAGFVRSTRGPLGGHELCRAPQDVSIWDILSVLEGSVRSPVPTEHAASGEDVVYDVWCELHGRSVDYLRSISLATLIEREQTREPISNYSI